MPETNFACFLWAQLHGLNSMLLGEWTHFTASSNGNHTHLFGDQGPRNSVELCVRQGWVIHFFVAILDLRCWRRSNREFLTLPARSSRPIRSIHRCSRRGRRCTAGGCRRIANRKWGGRKSRTFTIAYRWTRRGNVPAA